MATKAAKLIPLLDRVLIEKVAARTKTVGGILLPESATSKARPPSVKRSQRGLNASRQVNEGLVVSTGPGRRDKDGSLIPMGALKRRGCFLEASLLRSLLFQNSPPLPVCSQASRLATACCCQSTEGNPSS
jgi:co-chaperonin GroES (HSP10)